MISLSFFIQTISILHYYKYYKFFNITCKMVLVKHIKASVTYYWNNFFSMNFPLHCLQHTHTRCVPLDVKYSSRIYYHIKIEICFMYIKRILYVFILSIKLCPIVHVSFLLENLIICSFSDLMKIKKLLNLLKMEWKTVKITPNLKF